MVFVPYTIQVCATLDSREGLESSELWPVVPIIADDMPEASANLEEADQEAADPEPTWEDWPVQTKLAHVLDHLRQSYCYCLYCGCQVCEMRDSSCFSFRESTILCRHMLPMPRILHALAGMQVVCMLQSAVESLYADTACLACASWSSCI